MQPDYFLFVCLCGDQITLSVVALKNNVHTLHKQNVSFYVQGQQSIFLQACAFNYALDRAEQKIKKSVNARFFFFFR